MKKIIHKIKEFRQHQYFELMAAMAVLILAATAYFTILNRSYLVLILEQKDTQIIIDGKLAEDVKVDGDRYTIRLLPGTHTVRVKAPGKMEYAETISLIRGLYKTINPTFNLLPSVANQAAGEIQFLTTGKLADEVLYLGDSGQTLYRHNLKTNEKVALNNIPFSGIEEIRWSPDFKIAFLKKYNGIYLFDVGYYDLIHQDDIFLFPANKYSMPAWDFSKNDPQITKFRIAYISEQNGGFALYYANQLNEDREWITDLNNIGLANLVWSKDGNYLALYGRSGLSVFNTYTRQITTVLAGTTIAGVKFSPNSKYISFTTADNHISIISSDASNLKELSYETTIDRVVWNKDSDFLTMALWDNSAGSDEFIKLDIRNSETVNYFYNSAETIKVSRMILSSDESTLYFQSLNKLHSLLLKDRK